MADLKVYTDKFVLSPGPTEIPDEIRLALARKTTNPDLDPDFRQEYEQASRKLAALLGALEHDVLIMMGEAMLGLEASVVSLLDRGQKAIIVSNGVFGEGFAELVRAHGAIPIEVRLDWRRRLDASKVAEALDSNPDARVVYAVHCETPTGVLNGLEELGRIASRSGAVLVVDCVSSAGGARIEASAWNIDVLIVGSQKALNLPSGLTIMAINEKAWEAIEKRRPGGFYLNLALWRSYARGAAEMPPHTLSDSMVYALNASLDAFFREGPTNVFARHELAKRACWRAAEALGLEPYPSSEEDASPTVTALLAPESVNSEALRLKVWRKCGIMLGGGVGPLRGRVIRVGHMGFTASRSHVILAISALARGLVDEGLISRRDYAAAIEAAESVFE
ncbi:MAG: alanine--glyoxylate aminotransferase family protein [Fervidicoccaceae archaeon]